MAHAKGTHTHTHTYATHYRLRLATAGSFSSHDLSAPKSVRYLIEYVSRHLAACRMAQPCLALISAPCFSSKATSGRLAESTGARSRGLGIQLSGLCAHTHTRTHTHTHTRYCHARTCTSTKTGSLHACTRALLVRGCVCVCMYVCVSSLLIVVYGAQGQ